MISRKLILSLLFAVLLVPQTATSNTIDNVILLFGDSITSTRPHLPEGMRSGNVNGKNIGPTVKALEERLNLANKETLVLNYGFSGSTTAQGLARIANNIAAAKAAHPARRYFIGILYGTNDPTLGGISPTGTRDNLSAMIDIALEQGVTPVLGTLLPRTDGVAIGPYNTLIRLLAQERNVPAADFNTVWTANYSNLVESDGLHPTLEGYRVMGGIWFDIAFNALVPESKNEAFLVPIFQLLDIL